MELIWRIESNYNPRAFDSAYDFNSEAEGIECCENKERAQHQLVVEVVEEEEEAA